MLLLVEICVVVASVAAVAETLSRASPRRVAGGTAGQACDALVGQLGLQHPEGGGTSAVLWSAPCCGVCLCDPAFVKH